MRLAITAGRETATHRASGEVILQCLEGKAAVACLGQTWELEPGHLPCLPAGEPHSVKAIAEGSLLLTIVRPEESVPEVSLVDEASEESFPASDPPAWTGVTRA